MRCSMKILFYSQTYKSHHTPRNFGDWIMQQPQISIYKINIYRQENRRASGCAYVDTNLLYDL